MNTDRTLFAQVMDCVPWKTFGRIVVRDEVDRGVRRLKWIESFRVLVCAQLTCRTRLREVEVCLSAQAGKLDDMGLRRSRYSRGGCPRRTHSSPRTIDLKTILGPFPCAIRRQAILVTPEVERWATKISVSSLPRGHLWNLPGNRSL